MKGAAYARDLYGKVKESRAQESALSKKAQNRMQKRMASVRSDRGLKFERFVAGAHGAREVDLEGVEKHARAVADAGLISDEEEDDEDDDDDDDDEDDEEGGGGGEL